MTRHRLVIAATCMLALAVFARHADAYPQFQLSRDQTCSSCHISPAGGGLLNENGTNVSESISQFGTDGNFMYNAIPLPSWLEFGGDLRDSDGYLQTPEKYLVNIPMQADVYGTAAWGNFRIYLTGGYRPVGYGEDQFPLWSREHYLMWQQNLGSPYGLFVRAGRFMPVFGLRQAEHEDYDRRFGGTPLYSETYAAAIEWIQPSFEIHLTGFIVDPLQYSVEPGNGGSLYAEYRIDKATSVGVEGMIKDEGVSAADGDTKWFRGGITAKRYFDKPDILVQGELQFVNEHIAQGNTDGTYTGTNGLVGYLLGSWFAGHGIVVDAGYGHYAPDVRLAQLDRDCFDLNVHWFTTSHVELIALTRIELFDFGNGGPTGGYAMGMLHYRL
jgi:hypothetical protein